MTMKGGWSPRGGSVQGVAVARLAVDRPPMEEHAVQKVSHGLPTHTALEAVGVAVDVEVLDGDLGIMTNWLLAEVTGG